MKKLVVCFTFIVFSLSAFSQSQTNERARWFTNARFGMFIHWGVYSGAEGIWKGEKLRNDNDYAEWLMYRNRIDREEYLTLLDRFNWNEINPEEWVILAKKSGMKYVTFTAKHHDGFALWDSKVGDYDLGNYTNPKRDIVKELAEACKKHGLKLGLYYSHWVDWEHQYGWDHTKEVTGISAEKYDQYWQEKVIPQVRELLTNYGEIGMFWFDMWIHHAHTVVTKEQLLQLKSLIRELQPDCIVNSRLGLSVEEDPDVDFKTLGDNQLGSKKENFPWQSPATVAHSWGFHALDTEWKSTSTLLKSLINNVSLNGNFMLNIGPRADGSVPFEITQRMLEMGRWLNVNGEAIYDAEAFDLDKDLHDWGRITCKKEGNKTKLYLNVFNWPISRQLNFTGVSTKPDKIYLLADKQQKPLQHKHTGIFTQIELPVLEPDPFVSVVVVEYNQQPETVQQLVAKTTDNGFSLTPRNRLVTGDTLQIIQKNRRGTIPEHAGISAPEKLKWKIYIDVPGKKSIDVSYSFQGKGSEAGITIKGAGTTLTHKVEPTGKTVGEPKSDWIIDNFKSFRIGEILFPKKGFYEIELEATPGKEKVQFQWIWIK
ncbi:alpha-L-fucosidase [Mariniphaga anaerophila]|nr:alpha-L-fucosidase [Mariniphaga anaerophila]